MKKIYNKLTYKDGSLFEKNFLNVTWSVTNQCNLKCWYCEEWKNENFASIEEVDKILGLIKYLVSDVEYHRIYLFGGEPTLHPDFERILHNLKIYNVGIATNLHWNESVKESIRKHPIKIWATLHFIDKFWDIYKSILVEFKDLFQQVYLILDTKTTNYQYYEAELIKLGIPFEYQFLNDKKNEYLDLSDLKLYQFHDNKGNTDEYTFSEIVRHDLNRFKFWRCDAGKKNLFIDSDGKIYPCQMYKARKIGEVDKKNLHETICILDKCYCELYYKKEKIFGKY